AQQGGFDAIIALGAVILTLTRMANGDCLYLDRKTRLCTIYARRPDTCRNHPRIGPRPGYCAYRPR
ncbi:YkgJ family cysteine cluster protein, partial [Pseudomonas aeruginosa]|uniref:YkgJ family cysteine cluster protein n=1 Tax=Pseudomonas aeruginosa TaxID=287 RepID=UPI003969F05C